MSKTLLVADDALIIRQIIKDMATSAGWTVVGEAANGQEAIERYRQLRPMPLPWTWSCPSMTDSMLCTGSWNSIPRPRCCW